jgi:Rrf2 family cysteine metabolism transcriptional repressor
MYGAHCHIVNTASIAGLIAYSGTSIYDMTKHAVVALSESLYLELEQIDANVHVSVLCPALVQTHLGTAGRDDLGALATLPPREAASPKETALWQRFAQRLSAAGVAPELVANRTFQAIRAHQFYIFTHDQYHDLIQRRVDDMLHGSRQSAGASRFDRSSAAGCNMYISSKGEYGIRALFDLAQHYGIGPVQSRDIRVRQSLDENYLNQILISLRKAGLIESIRGPQGGHRLARPPAHINVLEALLALEGPLLPTDAGRDSQPTEVVDRDVVLGVWAELRAVIERYLAGITLDDLVQRKRQLAGEVMYYI